MSFLNQDAIDQLAGIGFLLFLGQLATLVVVFTAAYYLGKSKRD